MTAWQSISNAPRDGREILARRDNGCSREHVVVWWSDLDPRYPWQSDGNAYPADRFDTWHPIPSGDET